MSPKAARPPIVAADIAAARYRSLGYGLDPIHTAVRHVGAPGPAAGVLNQLSAPVIDDLLSQISGTSLAVAMADRNGRLIRCDTLSGATRTAMDARCLDIGFSLAEEHVGTNGVGTSLETRKPTFVAGDDHFLETFHGFTCANAPVFQPITGKVEASVGIMCPLEDTSALLLPTAIRLSRQISELMLEQATSEERFLLQQFLRSRRTSRKALATVGKDLLIATPTAQRQLAGIDHEVLWSHVQIAARQGAEIETDLEFPPGRILRLRCRPLYRDGDLEGAAIEVVTTPRPRAKRRGARSAYSLGLLVGESEAWRTVVEESLCAGQVDEPVLLVGERGTGKLAVAEAIARQRGARSVEVFSSAEIPLDGDRAWLLRLHAALSATSTVILQRVDGLPDDVAAAVALMGKRSIGPRMIATVGSETGAEPGLAALLDQLDVFRIEVPALRERRDDIAPLARHLASRRGRPQIDPQLVNALYRHAWPGNVTELDQVLRSALARARSGRLSVEHLPKHIRSNENAPLYGLRRLEADAIVSAIDSSVTRAEAAKQLGISRATLFRRIKAYGLHIPD